MRRLIKNHGDSHETDMIVVKVTPYQLKGSKYKKVSLFSHSQYVCDAFIYCVSFVSVFRAKEEALRIKKKIESDINDLEIALDAANKANAETAKTLKV